MYRRAVRKCKSLPVSPCSLEMRLWELHISSKIERAEQHEDDTNSNSTTYGGYNSRICTKKWCRKFQFGAAKIGMQEEDSQRSPPKNMLKKFMYLYFKIED